MTNAADRERLQTVGFGRIVFGSSAVIFGVASLMAHDSDTWQYLRQLPAPIATLVAWCLMLAQVTGGVGIAFARTVAPASLLLAAVYTLLVVARVALAATTPSDPGEYVDLFEQLAVVCGAFAVYAVAQTKSASPVSVDRALRMTYGVCLGSFAWAQIVYFRYTAGLVPTWIPPSQAFWTIVTTIAFGLGAVAALIDRRTQLALRLTTLMLVLFGLLIWVPRVVAHPATLSNWIEISLNFLIAASALLVGELSSSSSSSR
jgi:uncharacterized membrane protein YphA (DoxX/SURF4 family)